MEKNKNKGSKFDDFLKDEGIYEQCLEDRPLIIDCISDLHGEFPDLCGGDLLIVAGDLTAQDTYQDHILFAKCLSDAQRLYKKAIFIGGNHDNLLQQGDIIEDVYYETEYLCDSGTEFMGLKIWGSPWTETFEGMNPKCKAFTVDTDEELSEKFIAIPKDTDILITHSPPFGIMDTITKRFPRGNEIITHCGSESLLERVFYVCPKLHVFGHIHECHGEDADRKGMFGNVIKYVNASIMDEVYDPVNKPIRVIYDKKRKGSECFYGSMNEWGI